MSSIMTESWSMFWISNIIPVLMLALLCLQHVTVPNVYQEKFLSFAVRPRFEADQEQSRGSSSDLEQSHEPSSDFVANDSEYSLVEVKANGSEVSSTSDPIETETATPTILYQDECFTLTTRSTCISDLNWRLNYNSASLTTISSDDGGLVLSRFILAAMLQGSQLFLFKFTSRTILQLTKQHKIGLGFAFLLLMVPTVVCFTATALLLQEIKVAMKDRRLTVRNSATVVLKMLTIWLWFLMLCLALPWIQVIRTYLCS